MGSVVALRPRQRLRGAPLASPAFEEAWLAYPEAGRLRSSRKEALPEWLKAAAEIGEDTLAGAVKRYASEDKDHRKDHGAPGFHRWLKWGRYEHWLPKAPVVGIGQIFQNALARAAVIKAKDVDFCGAYLDPCTIEGTTVVARTTIAMNRLKEVGSILKAHGFTGMRRIRP